MIGIWAANKRHLEGVDRHMGGIDWHMIWETHDRGITSALCQNDEQKDVGPLEARRTYYVLRSWLFLGVTLIEDINLSCSSTSLPLP